MGNTICRSERQLKGCRVGNAGSINVGWCMARLVGEPANLVAGPMNQRDAYAQATQQSDVEQQIAKILILDEGAVHRDDEHFAAILRNIAEDFTKFSKTTHLKVSV